MYESLVVIVLFSGRARLRECDVAAPRSSVHRPQGQLPVQLSRAAYDNYI